MASAAVGRGRTGSHPAPTAPNRPQLSFGVARLLRASTERRAEAATGRDGAVRAEPPASRASTSPSSVRTSSRDPTSAESSVDPTPAVYSQVPPLRRSSVHRDWDAVQFAFRPVHRHRSAFVPVVPSRRQTAFESASGGHVTLAVADNSLTASGGRCRWEEGGGGALIAAVSDYQISGTAATVALKSGRV